MLQRKISNCYNEFLIEIGPRHQRADFRDFLSDREALKSIQAFREGYDWLTYVEISMLVPICADCKLTAEVQFGEQDLPEVVLTNWQDQYKSLGIAKNILAKMEREVRINNWKGLSCFRCLVPISFNESNGNFYIFSTPLTDYYGCKKGRGRSF